ncbi:MAG: dodecin family protein [Bacteroidetes bacterium]|nr:dodecin family protein [Bacteroidota bacterium]MBU2506143.1 dodecin family protein [Bacteroidota bacterium]
MASFEIIERVGISTKSLTVAVQNAVNEANKEKKVAWFEVAEQRGRVTNENEIEFQVTVKIGRKL